MVDITYVSQFVNGKENNVMNGEHIHIPDVLPHRYPFLFVDSVVGYEDGHWAKGYKIIDENDWFINESNLYMPSTLIVESLAQIGAFATMDVTGISFLTSLKGINVFSQVKVGEKLDLYYEVVKRRRGYVVGKGTAHAGERLIVEAEEIVSLDQKMS